MNPRRAPARMVVTAIALLVLPLVGTVGLADDGKRRSPITHVENLRTEFKARNAAANLERIAGRWKGPRPTTLDRSGAWQLIYGVLDRWHYRPRSLRLLLGYKPQQFFARWWTSAPPYPVRRNGAWHVRTLIASHKGSYRKLAMRLEGEIGTLRLRAKVGARFRLTDLARAHRLGRWLGVPIVLPSVATASNFLPTESQLKSTVFDLHFLVDGKELNVDVGEAEFDGCGGPDNATPITIAGKPALIEEDSPHAGSYVIWPASRDDPWARFGLFGPYPMSSLIRWADEMIRANRARHGESFGGC